MRRVGRLIIAVALFAGLFFGLFPVLAIRTAMAQEPARAERKIVSRTNPYYPETARRMRLGGVVKLEVVVRANGTIKSTKALGGSPVLIQAATGAVQQWRYEAAPEETTEVVQVKFDLP
jgi:TonB family protein